MKKIDFFTVHRMRSVQQEDFTLGTRWFDNKNFYFVSKRPESLGPGDISKILKGTTVFTDEKGKPVGLIKPDLNSFGNLNTILMEFSFPDTEYYTNGMGAKLLGSFFYDKFYYSVASVNKIMIRVFSFDAAKINFLDNLEIAREAVLKDHVFKFGAYHDVYIYGVLKTEFLESMKGS